MQPHGTCPSLHTASAGHKITGFARDEEQGTYRLEYEHRGQRHTMEYQSEDDTVHFAFKDEHGQHDEETYRRPPARTGSAWRRCPPWRWGWR